MSNDEKLVTNLILEMGENIYPISEESKTCDEKCEKLYKIENWAEMLYHLKEGKSKERFIELMNKSEYSKFFEGINYEYGINNYPKDLNKAFQIYKEAANNSTDSMCMFRMYHIYKNDFEKFNISKRNRVLEKFYIFKCYSFLRYPIIDRDENLCKRFNIGYEASIHLQENEDEECTKFHFFIEFLKTYYELYDINQNDLIIIESVFDYKLNIDKEKAIKNLTNLANKENLEALYKLTCFNKDQNEEETEKRFKFLFNKEYYRSYIDYALYLNSKNRYNEALEVLILAKNKGMISAGILYFNIFLENNDFSLLIKEAINSSFSKESNIFRLFNILIDDILIESVYSFFEFIFLRKIIVKHYNLEQKFNYYFYNFTKEIVTFIIKLVGESNIENNKKMVNRYFCSDNDFNEYNLACGTLYFYGINNIINVDLKKALDHFEISYQYSEGKGNKRFCYYYIYKTRKKLFEENKLNQRNENINYYFSEDDIKGTEKIIFNKNYSAINEENNIFSSSYYYHLSRLLHKKIGNNGDKLLEFICLKLAIQYINEYPFSGSIISYYRKNKSLIILKNIKMKLKMN